MAISRLATSNPASNTEILLYTGQRTILASVIATNKSSSPATIRVWVVPADQDPTTGNLIHISYNLNLPGADSIETFRFPVLFGDKVYISASTANISFTLSGIDDTTITGVDLQSLQTSISSIQSSVNSANSTAAQALVLALIDI
jgi:hypothetical protein